MNSVHKSQQHISAPNSQISRFPIPQRDNNTDSHQFQAQQPLTNDYTKQKRNTK